MEAQELVLAARLLQRKQTAPETRITGIKAIRMRCNGLMALARLAMASRALPSCKRRLWRVAGPRWSRASACDQLCRGGTHALRRNVMRLSWRRALVGTHTVYGRLASMNCKRSAASSMSNAQKRPWTGMCVADPSQSLERTVASQCHLTERDQARFSNRLSHFRQLLQIPASTQTPQIASQSIAVCMVASAHAAPRADRQASQSTIVPAHNGLG